uniref:Integrase core domain containing protein n=1 Tax=Solanum tuberosum TaxID=4113 RepID=M1D9L6_SOLTU
MGIVQSGSFQRDADHKETLLRWMAHHITENGERIEWADNVVTWDRVVMLATIMAGLEIDFSHILIAEIHERSFKTTTTLPFPCLIFHFCREASVPIWHCDRLLKATKTLDIGFIRDDANLAAPRREPHVNVPPWVLLLLQMWRKCRLMTPPF